MKKTLIVLFAMLSFLTINSNAQTESNELKYGFYTNYGNTKLNELTCYEFDNLMIRFEILPEMFTYDEVTIGVGWYSEAYAVTQQVYVASVPRKMKGGKWNYFYKIYTKEAFNQLFKNKKEGSLWVIAPDNGESHLKDKDGKTLTRRLLKYSLYEENLTQSYLSQYIFGQNIVGKETYFDNYSGSYKSRSRYGISQPWVKETKNKLPLNNRTLVKKEKETTEVNASNDCYMYNGAKSIESPLVK